MAVPSPLHIISPKGGASEGLIPTFTHFSPRKSIIAYFGENCNGQKQQNRHSREKKIGQITAMIFYFAPKVLQIKAQILQLCNL